MSLEMERRPGSLRRGRGVWETFRKQGLAAGPQPRGLGWRAGSGAGSGAGAESAARAAHSRKAEAASRGVWGDVLLHAGGQHGGGEAGTASEEGGRPPHVGRLSGGGTGLCQRGSPRSSPPRGVPWGTPRLPRACGVSGETEQAAPASRPGPAPQTARAAPRPPHAAMPAPGRHSPPRPAHPSPGATLHGSWPPACAPVGPSAPRLGLPLLHRRRRPPAAEVGLAPAASPEVTRRPARRPEGPEPGPGAGTWAPGAGATGLGGGAKRRVGGAELCLTGRS